MQENDRAVRREEREESGGGKRNKERHYIQQTLWNTYVLTDQNDL